MDVRCQSAFSDPHQKWWSAPPRGIERSGARLTTTGAGRVGSGVGRSEQSFRCDQRGSSLLTGATDAPRGTSGSRAGSSRSSHRGGASSSTCRSCRASDDGVSAGPRPGLAAGVHHRGRSPRRGRRGLAVAGGVHLAQGADGDEPCDGAQVVLPSRSRRDPRGDGAPSRRLPRVLGPPRTRTSAADAEANAGAFCDEAFVKARFAERAEMRRANGGVVPQHAAQQATSDSSSPEASTPTTTRRPSPSGRTTSRETRAKGPQIDASVHAPEAPGGAGQSPAQRL